jgi:hypothetical protein
LFVETNTKQTGTFRGTSSCVEVVISLKLAQGTNYADQVFFLFSSALPGRYQSGALD